MIYQYIDLVFHPSTPQISVLLISGGAPYAEVKELLPAGGEQGAAAGRSPHARGSLPTKLTAGRQFKLKLIEPIFLRYLTHVEEKFIFS